MNQNLLFQLIWNHDVREAACWMHDARASATPSADERRELVNAKTVALGLC
jgi:hypothetical protein